MTTAALVCEQAPVGKANANDLDRVSLKVTALPLPTVDPRIYPPALLSEDDLHILDSNYLSERTDASVNDDNNKNRPEARGRSTFGAKASFRQWNRSGHTTLTHHQSFIHNFYLYFCRRRIRNSFPKKTFNTQQTQL